MKLRDLNRNAITLTLPTFSRRSFWFRLAALVNRRLSFLGIQLSVSRYSSQLHIYLSNDDSKLYPAGGVYVNVGSGGFCHPRWDCLDYPAITPYYNALQKSSGRIFAPYDLCSSRPLPYLDNSVSLIYCSHTLEHISLSHCERFFHDCYRVLRPSGVLRLALPATQAGLDSIKYLHQYSSPESRIHFEEHIRTVANRVFSDSSNLSTDTIENSLVSSLYNSALFIETLKKTFKLSDEFDPTHPEKHISDASVEVYANFGRQAGFTLIIPQFKNISIAPPFTNPYVFDTTEPHISLYLDLRK